MNGADEDTTDGLVGALLARASAELERGSTTLRLALAETRLAASSALLLLGIVLGIGILGLLIWLLLVALAAYGLWRLGLSPALALGALLGVHVVAALALALLARRLVRDLGFTHTRLALAGATSGRSPADGDDPGRVAPGTRARTPLTRPSDAAPPGTESAARTRD